MRQTTTLVTAIVLLVSAILYADDTTVRIGGGSAAPIAGVNVPVEMVQETVIATLYQWTYDIDATFTFRNNSDTDVSVAIGFPQFRVDELDLATIQFTGSWIDGTPHALTTLPDEDPMASGVDSWHVREVAFDAGQSRTTRVTYTSEYSHDGRTTSFDYLYGTGGAWEGPIGMVTFVIANDSPYWLSQLSLPSTGSGEPAVHYGPDNRVSMTMHNVEPGPTDMWEMDVSRSPEWLVIAAWTDFTEGYAALMDPQRRFDYRLLSSAQLRILRNSVFAIHGCEFHSADLQDYFGNQWWYNPDPNFSTSDLSQAELSLVEYIESLEALHQSE
jgi:hypothetical protein